MVLPPYAVLDALHRGRGSVEMLSTLAEYAVFSELLALRGHSSDSLHAVQCAQAALLELASRGPAAEWTLPVAIYAVLSGWLTHYVGQLELAGLQGILLAHAELPAFVASRAIELKKAA
jgi:hypothetical protein